MKITRTILAPKVRRFEELAVGSVFEGFATSRLYMKVDTHPNGGSALDLQTHAFVSYNSAARVILYPNAELMTREPEQEK